MTATPAMELAEIDTRLQALRDAVATLGAALFDIDALPTRTMLDPKALRGATAQTAAPVLDTLAAAWQRYPTLTDLLDGCDRVRGTGGRLGTRERDQLGEMLVSKNAEGFTPTLLAADLTRRLDAARTAIQQVDDAWRILIPRAGAIDARITSAQQLADSMGEQSATLTQVRTRLDALRTGITADPIGADPRAFDALDVSVASLERELHKLRTKRDTLERNIEQTEQQIDTLRSRIAEGIAAAQRVRSRISAPGAPRPLSLDVIDRPGGLRPRADAMRNSTLHNSTLHNSAPLDWRRAVRDLDGWNRELEQRLAEATLIRDANMALLERRDQLRGRLDALKVKAARTGRAEAPEIDAMHRAAHEVLHKAPVDLDAAEALVAQYAAAIGRPSDRGSDDSSAASNSAASNSAASNSAASDSAAESR